ncbi:MAG: thioredoxin [Bdellovibrionales bacterium]|nr:thioredoxin [Bdellovibrionales bacterium]
MGNIAQVSDASFDSDVIKSDQPVLVDFWAAWCGPCRALAPKIEELSASYTGKVKFVKMDVDANPQVPPQFGIRGIPTLILFKGGKMVDQLVGNQPKEVIEQLLAKSL